MQKLVNIQKRLKAPKGQLNKFGGYLKEFLKIFVFLRKRICLMIKAGEQE